MAALAADRVGELRRQIDYLASTVALLPVSPRRAAGPKLATVAVRYGQRIWRRPRRHDLPVGSGVTGSSGRTDHTSNKLRDVLALPPTH